MKQRDNVQKPTDDNDFWPNLFELVYGTGLEDELRVTSALRFDLCMLVQIKSDIYFICIENNGKDCPVCSA